MAIHGVIMAERNKLMRIFSENRYLTAIEYLAELRHRLPGYSDEELLLFALCSTEVGLGTELRHFKEADLESITGEVKKPIIS